MLDKDEKINELLADKEFFKKITSMKTIEEVVEAFEDEGIEISVEEVQEIGAMINEVVSKLNEEALEKVSGGGSKGRQLAEGFLSGAWGPGWAYGSMGNSMYTKPETKGQKAARYAGIAIGATLAVGSAGLPWVVGAAIYKATNKNDDKNNKHS